MRESERGFTLVEMVIAVAIAAILLVAGGVWRRSRRPGALRGAVNDFDSALAVARQLAATSGNGATLAFIPRTDGADGFTLRVYSGRPNATNAVVPTNTMIVSSNATVNEATYGSPPFAIFLSSAGYPTGKASYPTVGGSGNVTFPVVATQPPCPAGGIVLTFKSPQGVTQTRSLKCNVVVAGVAAANPSPTPNPPHIVPQFMLAHWTNDANPLQFRVAEIGYTHWFTSSTGVDCQTQGSDNGSAPASFPAGWPYSSPLTPGETSLSPSAPASPYSWPNGNVDDPAASFHMRPSIGGMCTVRIVDDYNQEVDAHVQVMGNLTSNTASLTFNAPTDPAQTIILSKTWDNEPLQLQAGGGCRGVITASKGSIATPASPGTIPVKAQLIIAPIAAGSCILLVGDQYGEPTTSIPIDVKNPIPPVQTWPQQLVLGPNAGPVGTSTGTLIAQRFDFGSIVNSMFSGGVARAATGLCYAAGVSNAWVQGDAFSGYADSSLPSPVANALGLHVDSNGCEVDASGTPLSGTRVGVIAYNPKNATVTYAVGAGTTCNGTFVALTGWNTNNTAVEAVLGAEGRSQGSCSVMLSDGGSQTYSADHGLVSMTVPDDDCMQTPCLVGPDQEDSADCEATGDHGGGAGGYADTTVPQFTSGGNLGTLSVGSDGNFYFTRTAPGTVKIELWVYHTTIKINPATDQCETPITTRDPIPSANVTL